jgi:hypothetical protein
LGNGQTGQEHIDKMTDQTFVMSGQLFTATSSGQLDPASSKLLLRFFIFSKLVLFFRSFTVSAFSLLPMKVCKIISPYGKSFEDSTIKVPNFFLKKFL